MPYQPASRLRTQSPFRREEWELLVRLPGRVVIAATSAVMTSDWRRFAGSAAEADRGRQTVAEGLAGIDAIAAGRFSASPLVREVVAAIYDETGDEEPVAEEFRDRARGIAEVVAACRTGAALLAERVSREDADAYRHWLESIAARVCQAARSGGIFGLGGMPVSDAERRFLADLGAALHH
jgi:hypothetical protein